MTISAITINLFGQRSTMYRVMDGANGVVHVAETREAAEAWIKAAA